MVGDRIRRSWLPGAERRGRDLRPQEELPQRHSFSGALARDAFIGARSGQKNSLGVILFSMPRRACAVGWSGFGQTNRRAFIAGLGSATVWSRLAGCARRKQSADLPMTLASDTGRKSRAVENVTATRRTLLKVHRTSEQARKGEQESADPVD